MIETSGHLPECFATTPIEQRTPSVCICDRLRACEARVLADFLTSIDEDYPVYLRGHSVGIRDGIQIGRVMAAYDVGWLGAWFMRADALNLTDGMRLVRLNDAVKAARGDQS